MEQSYVDILIRLDKDVKNNTTIPADERKKIENHILALEELLWKYSA